MRWRPTPEPAPVALDDRQSRGIPKVSTNWRWKNMSSERAPFDHAQMARDGLERLRGELWYSNVAVGFAREIHDARGVDGGWRDLRTGLSAA